MSSYEDETVGQRYARIDVVLAQAKADGVSAIIARSYGMPSESGAFADRFWDGLRENLSHEDALVAVEMLMRNEMTKAALDVIGGLPE